MTLSSLTLHLRMATVALALGLPTARRGVYGVQGVWMLREKGDVERSMQHSIYSRYEMAAGRKMDTAQHAFCVSPFPLTCLAVPVHTASPECHACIIATATFEPYEDRHRHNELLPRSMPPFDG